MKFLKFRNDYLQNIAPDELNELLASNTLDKEEAFLDIEAMAVSTITGHLEDRYDLEGLRGSKFRQAREQVKCWAIAIAAYLLYERAKAKVAPEIAAAYDKCMKELEALRSGSSSWQAPLARGEMAPEWSLNNDLDWGFETGAFDADFQV